MTTKELEPGGRGREESVNRKTWKSREGGRRGSKREDSKRRK